MVCPDTAARLINCIKKTDYSSIKYLTSRVRFLNGKWFLCENTARIYSRQEEEQTERAGEIVKQEGVDRKQIHVYPEELNLNVVEHFWNTK